MQAHANVCACMHETSAVHNGNRSFCDLENERTISYRTTKQARSEMENELQTQEKVPNSGSRLHFSKRSAGTMN